MTLAKFGLAFMAVAGTTLTSALAQELSFRDFPYLVYCEAQGVDRAFYFSRLGADGVARRVGGEQTGSCANKTIEELRSSGQAYDLPK